ncbi:MAG: hypothetical protein IT506_07620 [Aquabacterium sp.]|nr:hypothetical protein [Aquabacterium sp.]
MDRPFGACSSPFENKILKVGKGREPLEADMFALRNQFQLDDKVRFTRERLAILSPQDRRRLEGRIGVVVGNFNGTRKPVVYFPADFDRPDLRLFGVDLRQLELVDEEHLPPQEAEFSEDLEDSPGVSHSDVDDLFA